MMIPQHTCKRKKHAYCDSHLGEYVIKRALRNILMSALSITHTPLFALFTDARCTHTNDTAALWARGTEPCLPTFCRSLSAVEMCCDRSRGSKASTDN